MSSSTLLLPVDPTSSSSSSSNNNNHIRGVTATNATDFVKYQLPFYEEQYVHVEDLRISVTSFNVATKKPPASSLSFLSPILANQPDLVVIGLQEVDMSASALIREETEASGPWLNAILKEVGCDYYYNNNKSQSQSSSSSSTKPYFLICSKQMVGLMLIVCGRRSSFFNNNNNNDSSTSSSRIREVVVNTVATGALGTVGNKGAIGIRIACERSNFCFINCHLAAHQHAAAKRNEDITEILSRMNLQVSTAVLQDQYIANQFSATTQQPNINYNISGSVAAANAGAISTTTRQSGSSSSSGGNYNNNNYDSSSSSDSTTYTFMPDQQYKSLQSTVYGGHANPADLYPLLPKDCDQLIILGDLNYRVDLSYEAAVALCAKNDIKGLLKEDQLTKEVRHPHSPWHDFTDLTPNFLPTYRFDIGTDNYDTSEKKRIPSFTDRILFWNTNNSSSSSSSSSTTLASPTTTATKTATNTASDQDNGSNNSNNNNNNNSSSSRHLPTVSLFTSIHKQATCSDHKPIYALMTVPLKSIDPSLYEQTSKSLQNLVQELGLQNPQLQPSVVLSETEIDFGECSSVDRDEVVKNTRTILIKNTSKSVAEIAVLRRALSHSDPSDATWLRVAPPSSSTSFFILPGATYDLDVTCVADWSSLRWIVNELPFSSSASNNGGTFKLKSDLSIVVRPLAGSNNNNNNNNTKPLSVHCSCSLRPTCHAMTLDILLRCGNIPVREAYTLSARPAQEEVNNNAATLKPQIPKELWYLSDAICKFPHVPGLFTDFATEQDALVLLDELSRKSACLGGGNNNKNIVVCAAEQCPPNSISIYSIAVALVVFLRDLQVAVIPSGLLSAAVAASKQGPSAVMKFTTEQLPTAHYNVFVYVMSLLRFLLQRQNTVSNELTAQSLAQVFAVILFPLNSASRPSLGSKPAWFNPNTTQQQHQQQSGGSGDSSSYQQQQQQPNHHQLRAQADDEYSCAMKFILSFL